MASYLPRGIDPELLVSQVKNTMPYLFSDDTHVDSNDMDLKSLLSFPPAQVLRSPLKPDLNHFEYFRLCLSSHYLTCATPVPTDVDNQIRHKLWPENLPIEIAIQMADLVIKSRRYDFTTVTRRFVFGASSATQETKWDMEALSGHLGEWFTVAAGAYCALKRYDVKEAKEKRSQIFEEVRTEVNRHSEIFGSLWRSNDGLGCLKASASIAHNFGDLDRVMDMWDLAIEDPLKLEYYKLAISPFDANRNLRFLGRLWVAGELYKELIHGSSMAFENHRHFALRKPKCLRLHPSLMIQTGPFLDLWGRTVAKFLANPDGSPTENTIEVIEALQNGRSRLPKSLGYGRALRGILDIHPELEEKCLPKVYDSSEAFEKKWAVTALKLMDDIPSRAK